MSGLSIKKFFEKKKKESGWKDGLERTNAERTSILWDGKWDFILWW
jgi:hypothetical protein